MDKTIEIIDWKGLLAYTKLLSNGDETKVKIFFIDEENEEIRLDNEEDFQTNVQFARDRNETNLILKIYLDGKFIFQGFYSIKKPLEFPREHLEKLNETVLAEQWFIPVKQDESLAICLNAAIQFAAEGQSETNVDCEKFIETILPEVFKKLITTPLVDVWPREIHCGIFEKLEFLVDLVAIRIRRSPVPTTLLDILGMSFDTNTKFWEKHQNELLPSRRSYQLIEKEFVRGEKFGWLTSLLQRFIAQDALNYLRLQFEYVDSANSTKAATEFNVLLNVFSRCDVCVNPQRFRLIFSRPIQQTIQHLKRQSKPIDSQNIVLNETLMKICQNYHLDAEYDQLLALAFDPRLTDSSPLLIDFDAPAQFKPTNEKIRPMTMENFTEDEREVKNFKKQKTEEQIAPLFTRQQLIDSIRELTAEKERHQTSNSSSDKKSMPSTSPSDQLNSDELLRLYAPMKEKIGQLYDELQLATRNGQIRDVIKIEEKLKLLNPFSGRFVADGNYPDGTFLLPGERFRKTWILLNDGSLPWDNESIHLVNLINQIVFVEQPIVSVTGPHTRTEIHVDFVAPMEFGVYESKWILSYRDQTFGPMFWCQIEVRPNDDVPLPACFDLTKPFCATRVPISLPKPIDDPVEKLTNDFERIDDFLEITNESVSLPPPLSPIRSESVVNPRPINTVMNSFVNVAKQAGSTAKAIFNTLQANEEPSRSSRVMNSSSSVRSIDPMARLLEMGFANRTKNQRLLRENGNDLAKVIELLTLDSHEDREWFDHRH